VPEDINCSWLKTLLLYWHYTRGYADSVTYLLPETTQVQGLRRS